MQETLPEQAQPQEPAGGLPRMDRRLQRSEILSYMEAAEVLSIDSDLRFFNRFNELHIFVILCLQHRLASMTEELARLRTKPISTNSDEAEKDAIKLDDISQKIQSTLKDYDTALLAHARIENFTSPPSELSMGYINDWATNFPLLSNDLTVNKSGKFNSHALATLASGNKSWAHRQIDRSRFLQRYLAKSTVHKKGRTMIETYSEERIRRAELIFTNVTFIMMLFCPIIALSFVESVAGKLSIVLGFLLLGAFLTSGILTQANNTGLAVLAGYGAILIFFLGVKVDLSS